MLTKDGKQRKLLDAIEKMPNIRAMDESAAMMLDGDSDSDRYTFLVYFAFIQVL